MAGFASGARLIESSVLAAGYPRAKTVDIINWGFPAFSQLWKDIVLTYDESFTDQTCKAKMPNIGRRSFSESKYPFMLTSRFVHNACIQHPPRTGLNRSTIMFHPTILDAVGTTW